MARMVYAEEFLEGASLIWSDSVRSHLVNALHAIEAFPEIGSTDVPVSLRERYGESVRKFTIRPFDLVYEYDGEADTVLVYGLVPFRRAR